MSKYTNQDIIDEEGAKILSGVLDPNFFFTNEFAKPAGKDRYPDIDGQIRLRDGNGIYLNRYLHYQLKSTASLKSEKYFCNRRMIHYLVDTNVPTLLFVADIENQRVFWYFLDADIIEALELKKDKKGRTFGLKGREIRNNSLELNRLWRKFAKVDDYKKLSDSLIRVVSDFQTSVVKCVGLLYLLQRVPKKQLPNLFSKILSVDLNEINVIIRGLHEEEIITSTTNFYLLENERLGVESLFNLLADLNLDALYSIFARKEERVIILRQLAKIEHPAVSNHLLGLTEELLEFIKNPTNNDDVFANLELLEEYVYRVPKKALKIIQAIVDSKTPLKPIARVYEGFGPFAGKSHEDLIIKCIELLNRIRYLEAKKVFNLLIKLSRRKDAKSKAMEVLNNLCKYDLFALQKIGYYPQRIVLDDVQEWGDRKLKVNIEALLEICKQLLQPSFGGRSMSDYKTLHIHFGTLIISEELKGIRRQVMSLLKKLYELAQDLTQRKQILQTLQQVTQTPHQSNYGEDMEQMVLSDTNSLIDYYIHLLPEAKNEIIRDIDEQIHWFIRWFGTEALPKVDQLQSMIALNTDYEIFRVFVGYDLEPPEGLDWEEAAERRKKRIQEFASSVSDVNFRDWQKKILSIASRYSPSDPGEFQYFNVFLFELGRQKPELAMRLMRQNEKELETFLVHIVAGIWKSIIPESAKNIVSQWVKGGKHLPVCAYIFDYVGEVDRALLEEILKKAKATKDIQALKNMIPSILRSYPTCENLKVLFLGIVKELTRNNDWSWVYVMWYRGKPLLGSLTEEDYEIVLENLILVPSIDYHIERILSPAAEKYPERTIAFLQKRVIIQAEKKRDERYDALPYSLNTISEPLRKHAEVVVLEILRWFSKKQWWEANNLSKAIFPCFDEVLERTLLELIRSGGKQNVSIVFSILRAYRGERALHNICKELIRRYPKSKEYREEMFTILSSQTGMVPGEYGFVKVYERKKEEIQDWEKDESNSIQSFVDAYENYLDERISYEQKRADEKIELMKRNIR